MVSKETFVVFYRITPADRVSSEIDLSDYRQAGAVKAQMPSEAFRKWNQGNYLACPRNHRRLSVGDVLKLEDVFYVLTPSWKWATVVVVGN